MLSFKNYEVCKVLQKNKVHFRGILCESNVLGYVCDTFI